MASEIESKMDTETRGDAMSQPIWVKPEIATFLPITAAQGSGFSAGEGTNNIS